MKTRFGWMAAVLIASGLVCNAGSPSLSSWAVNIDGTATFLSRGSPPPPAMDLTEFDTVTGLGTMKIRVAGLGPHFVGVFLDHDIDDASNTFFNEFGSASGSPAPGQSWEIAELGYRTGTLYKDLFAGKLANASRVTRAAPDDVAMALAWNFTAAAGEVVLVEMTVGESPPASGFYLTQTDPLSNRSVYFSSALRKATGDSQLPVIVCPPNLVLDADPGLCSRSNATYTVTATDDQPGVTVVCTPTSGSTFPLGSTIVNCLATDASGNTKNCAFGVTVRGSPPVIKCPGNIIFECARTEGQKVDFEVTATSPCGAGVTVTSTPPSGTLFPLGATQVNCRAVDAAGGVSECSFTVFLAGTDCEGEFGLMKSACLAGEVHADPLMYPYPCGTCVNLAAAAAEGWTFMGWLGDARGTNESTTITMTQRKCVEAVFGIRISVTASTNGVAWVDPVTPLYPCGSVVRLLAKPNTGYYFSHWTNSLNDLTAPAEFTIERTNATVTPVFLPLPSGEFALTLETLGSGRVLSQPSRRLSHFPAGTNVILNALPDLGQEFKGWSYGSDVIAGAPLFTNNPLTVLMDTNKHFTAHFTRRPSLELVRCQGQLDKDLFQFEVHGRLLDTFVIETCLILGDPGAWKEVAREVNVLGAVAYEEPYLAGVSKRYYRARALEDSAVSPSEPRLSAVRVGEDLELSWPLSASAFQLESTLDLHPPIQWAPVSDVPSVAGQRVILHLVPTNSARFFRLRSSVDATAQ